MYMFRLFADYNIYNLFQVGHIKIFIYNLKIIQVNVTAKSYTLYI